MCRFRYLVKHFRNSLKSFIYTRKIPFCPKIENIMIQIIWKFTKVFAANATGILWAWKFFNCYSRKPDFYLKLARLCTRFIFQADKSLFVLSIVDLILSKKRFVSLESLKYFYAPVYDKISWVLEDLNSKSSRPDYMKGLIQFARLYYYQIYTQKHLQTVHIMFLYKLFTVYIMQVQ